MKTLVTFFTALALPLTLVAQDDESAQTLFGRDKGTTGWYVEFPASYGQTDNSTLAAPGFGFGVTADNQLSIGFRAHGLTRGDDELYFGEAYNGDGAYMEGGYAGLLVEPKLSGNQPFHLSFPMLFALGGASYTSSELFPEWDEDELDYHRKVLDTDAFLVFEPGVQLEVNVFRFMRFGMGVSYRCTKGIEFQDVRSTVLNGANFTTSLKFGKFR
ncbi:MAG: hypothetical protein U0T82_08970 [Bacteroidales bacterium]